MKSDAAPESRLDAYTPQRLRSMASLAYRVAAGNLQVREIGDYLVACAIAADEHGDLLQQRDHLQAELSRLHAATAEADAQRIRADALQRQVDEALRIAAASRIEARREKGQREALEAEVRGSRLWFELARLLVEEAQPLLPPDKAALIEPLRAAKVAASDRQRLAAAMGLLRSVRGWASLAAANDRDPACAGLVARIDALLEQPPK